MSHRQRKCREILSSARSCKFQMCMIRTMFLQKHDWILQDSMFNRLIFKASFDPRGQACDILLECPANNAGTFRGMVWFYLRFVDKVSGTEGQQTISAQPVQIDAANFFGFSGGLARTAGGIGSIIGAVLGFPFADDIIKWLYGRLKKSV